MKDDSATYGPVTAPEKILEELLDLYWLGLRMPLRFFPQTSMEFVLTGENLSSARRKWESAFSFRGEQEDPHFGLCFGAEEDPLTGDFPALSLRFFSPLVGHRETEGRK